MDLVGQSIPICSIFAINHGSLPGMTAQMEKGAQWAPLVASMTAGHLVKLIASEVWKGARGGTNTTLSRT